jgi:hypothetical protein
LNSDSRSSIRLSSRNIALWALLQEQCHPFFKTVCMFCALPRTFVKNGASFKLLSVQHCGTSHDATISLS